MLPRLDQCLFIGSIDRKYVYQHYRTIDGRLQLLGKRSAFVEFFEFWHLFSFTVRGFVLLLYRE